MTATEGLIGRVFNPERVTKFEKTRIIGARALQIAVGAPLLMEIKGKLTEPIDLAKMEFAEGVIPISVRRAMPKKLEKK
ncbi:MAG: DNA-directed RNA polymerase subunit K [Candidatus Aenigmatarchaeota archaeon]|nr:MAG: DNA-directed RNA polymerase subunit K [Candidatus Aenigmarchaeota archaeon]